VRRECPEVAQEGLLAGADVYLQQPLKTRGEPVAVVAPGTGRARRDIDHVVANLLVPVILAELGPEGLQLVAREARSGGRSRFVEQDRSHRAAETVARPARHGLVLAVRRLPSPRRGAEELVVLQKGRGNLVESAVGADEGCVIVEIGKPGRVV